MMDYNMMGGAGGGGLVLLSSVSYLLVNILLVLGIAALWKYINHKK